MVGEKKELIHASNVKKLVGLGWAAILEKQQCQEKFEENIKKKQKKWIKELQISVQSVCPMPVSVSRGQNYRAYTKKNK